MILLAANAQSGPSDFTFPTTPFTLCNESSPEETVHRVFLSLFYTLENCRKEPLIQVLEILALGNSKRVCTNIIKK